LRPLCLFVVLGLFILRLQIRLFNLRLQNVFRHLQLQDHVRLQLGLFNLRLLEVLGHLVGLPGNCLPMAMCRQ
jgi:hypothetical protein